MGITWLNYLSYLTILWAFGSPYVYSCKVERLTLSELLTAGTDSKCFCPLSYSKRRKNKKFKKRWKINYA